MPVDEIWRFSMRKSLAHSAFAIAFLVGSAVAQLPEPSLAQTISTNCCPTPFTSRGRQSSRGRGMGCILEMATC